jgi:hypothetical protein
MWGNPSLKALDLGNPGLYLVLGGIDFTSIAPIGIALAKGKTARGRI